MLFTHPTPTPNQQIWIQRVSGLVLPSREGSWVKPKLLRSSSSKPHPVTNANTKWEQQRETATWQPSLLRAPEGATFEASLQTVNNRPSERPKVKSEGSHGRDFVCDRPGVEREEAWDAGPPVKLRAESSCSSACQVLST